MAALLFQPGGLNPAKESHENTEQEIERRKAVALAAIKESADDGDSSVALFVSHHLEELEPSYWLEQAGTEQPGPMRVLELLEFREHWDPDDDEDIEIFDFTLPAKVTNYVISVAFDDEGEIEGIEMES